MEERTVTIRIGEMGVVANNHGVRSVLKTTLGSCVGVILSDAARGIHGLAHVMLPEKLGADPAVGKYVDTAVPALVGEMERAGSRRDDIRAFLIGGANMFQRTEATNLPLIGEQNVKAAMELLEELGIPVVFRETGGVCGRTVTFDGSQPRIRTLTGSQAP
jgi:chemotaxis protein CheD